MPRLSARTADRVPASSRAPAPGTAPAAARRKRSRRPAGKPRDSRWRRFRSPPLRRIAAAVVAIAVCGGAVHSWKTGSGAHAVRKLQDFAVSASAGAGLVVNQILVEGRSRTPSEELRSALGLTLGDPIFGVNLEDAKARLESLGWIASATVERRLPDTLYIRVVERRPRALWQHNRVLRVVDATGAVITRHDVERFRRLLHIVGPQAPQHLPELLGALAVEDAIRDRISAAVWVGGRRWNLRIDDRLDVKLPEGSVAKSWRRLLDLHGRARVLDSDIVVLDLRQPDRIIVRPHPDAGVESEELDEARDSDA